MKKLFILFFLSVVVTPVAKSQQIGTQSFFNYGTSGWETIAGLAIDNSGNYYVAGTFSRKMEVNGTTLYPQNASRDIFILKYSKEHNFLWAKHFGGSSDDNIYSLDCDNAGNLYLNGSFRKNIVLGNKQFEAKAFTNVFFTCLNPEGKVLFAKALYSKASAQKTLLHVSGNGSIWLAGSFKGNIELDSLTNIEANSGTDIFIARYDNTGKLLNHGHIFGVESENVLSLTVDTTGALYLAGSYTGEINFGRGATINYGKEDLFIAKYDTTANRIWYKVAGGKDKDQAVSLSVDTSGFLYITGNFKQEIHIGRTILNTEKDQDAFMIKSHQSNGTPVWLKQFNATSYNTVNTIKVTGSGNIYLSGNFTGTILNDTDTKKSKGKAADAFIACYAQDGSRKWINTYGNLTEDNIFIDYDFRFNRLFAYGYFNENIDFANQHVFNEHYKDIYFGEIINCEQVAKIDLGADTVLCSGSLFSADSSFVSYVWSSGEDTHKITPAQTGFYTLQVSDIYGCQSDDSVFIEVLPKPEINLGEDIVAEAGDTIKLSVTDTLAFYLWTSGDTTHSISIAASAFNPAGTLGLTAGLANGCTGYNEISISIAQTPPATIANNSGNDNFSESDKKTNPQNENLESFSEYKIYPNPNEGIFYIEIPDEFTKIDWIAIFDSKGKLIKRFDHLYSNPFKINISSYPKGVYLVLNHFY